MAFVMENPAAAANVQGADTTAISRHGIGP